MENIFTNIWNEAYTIFLEDGIIDLQSYLNKQVKHGKITRNDAEMILDDLMECFA